jgi:hypothetical protein
VGRDGADDAGRGTEGEGIAWPGGGGVGRGALGDAGLGAGAGLGLGAGWGAGLGAGVVGAGLVPGVDQLPMLSGRGARAGGTASPAD